MCSAQSMPIACQAYKLRRLCDMTQPKTQEDQASAFQLQLVRLPLDKDTLDLGREFGSSLGIHTSEKGESDANLSTSARAEYCSYMHSSPLFL